MKEPDENISFLFVLPPMVMMMMMKLHHFLSLSSYTSVIYPHVLWSSVSLLGLLYFHLSSLSLFAFVFLMMTTMTMLP